MAFSGQNPFLQKYAKRYTELCADHFRDNLCVRGDSCTFAHKAGKWVSALNFLMGLVKTSKGFEQ